MTRRSFLTSLGIAVVALNATFGFRPSANVEAEDLPAVAEQYRMVVSMTALEDIVIGSLVVRVGDEGVRLAQSIDETVFGVAERTARKGQSLWVCTMGEALLVVT